MIKVNIYKGLTRILCCLFLMVFAAGTVHAGTAALSTQQKQQFVQAAIGSTGNALKTNDQATARAFLVASAEMVMKMARFDRTQQGKQLVQTWMNMRAQAWPGEGVQPDPAKLQAFIKEYDAVKMELGKCGLRFNMFNPPSGQRAYWEHVAGIHAEYQVAQKFVKDFTMKAPPADQLVSNPAVFGQVSQGLQAIFNIMFGPFLAYEEAQKRVIPDVVKYGNTNLDQAEKIDKPEMMLPQLNASSLSVKLLKTLAPKGNDLPALEARHKKAVERMNMLYDAQIAQNRMLADCWKVTGNVALTKSITELYNKIYPKDEVVKVNLTSENWHEGYEGWWEKNVWYSAYAGYCNAAVAVKQTDGKYRVFSESFRRTRNDDGSWTGLRKWETLGNYRILPENIK